MDDDDEEGGTVCSLMHNMCHVALSMKSEDVAESLTDCQLYRERERVAHFRETPAAMFVLNGLMGMFPLLTLTDTHINKHARRTVS